MKYNLQVPEGKAPIVSRRKLHQPVATKEYSVGDALGIFQNGGPGGYATNRGDGGCAVATVKRVRTGLHVPSLNTIITTPDRIVDGHSRLMGLNLRWLDGNLTKEEQEGVLAIKVINDDEFLDSYQNSNAGKAHTAGNKIENPDLAWGDVIYNKLQPLVAGESWGYLRSSHKLNLVYNLYGQLHLDDADKDDYSKIFGQRKYTKPLLDLAAGKLPFTIPESLLKQTAEGIEFYGKFCQELEDVAAGSKISFVLGSGPFFGVVLSDQYKEEALRDFKKASTLARRFKREMQKMGTLLPTLTHSSETNMYATVVRIKQLLCRN